MEVPAEWGYSGNQDRALGSDESLNWGQSNEAAPHLVKNLDGTANSVLNLAVVFEGHLDLGPVSRHFAVFQLQVQLDDFRNPQISETLGCHFHGRRSRFFPRLTAGAYQLNHLVYTICHFNLLSLFLIL
jgi:hypothetical protein